MVVVPDHFADLDFEDSFFDPPEVACGRVSVPVDKLGFWPGHPLFGRVSSVSARLVFDGVTRCVREVTPYAGARTENRFHPMQVVDDGPFPDLPDATDYAMEGVLTSPLGWVTWAICSQAFRLEVDSTDSARK